MFSNLFVVTSLLLFSVVFGQTCTNFEDETSCENADLCRWISSIDGDDYCGCASSVDLNVIFVMDESGSVGSSNFEDQVDFVEELILTALEPDDSIALITFGFTVNVDYSFSDSQIEADVLAGLNSISYNGGGTPTLDALNLAITEFNNNGDPNKENVLFLITDGTPSSSSRPCDDDIVKTALDAAGVTVVIIGVGSFNLDPITCLVDDESQIIEVDGFSLESFEAVRDLTDAFLCQEAKKSVSLTPENPVDGDCMLSMIENDNNEMVDGVYQCNNDDYNSLCAKLEFPSLNCGDMQIEEIELTIYAEKISGDTDLFTIVSKGSEYFAILNDYAGANNPARVGPDADLGEFQLPPPQLVRRRSLLGKDPRGVPGGVFMTPRCGSFNLHTIGRDIEKIWKKVDTSKYFDNRRELSKRDMDDWTRITSDDELVGRASMDNPITIKLAMSNMYFSTLSVEFESENVLGYCSYPQFEFSDDEPFKILFATDSGTISMHEFDVKHSCKSLFGAE